MNKNTRLGLLASLSLAIAVLPAVARACKPVVGFLRPSNYELVKAAERIVLARVIGFEPTCRTTFDVLAPLKGELPAAELSLEGCSMGAETAVPPDDAASFARARRSDGACIPVTYEQHQSYVLFLGQEDGAWVVAGPAFTRVNEPVGGSTAPWLRAVERYVDIAGLPDPAAENTALRALQASGARSDDPALRLLSADVTEHFATVSDYKSYAELRQFHDRATDDAQRDRVLWAWANRGDLEARPLFDELLAAGQSHGAVAAYFEKLGDKSTLGRFADAFLAAGNTDKDWWARSAPLGALLALADGSDIDLVLQVYAKATEQHEATMVAEWMALHPDPRLRDALRERIAGNYAQDSAATFALAASGDEAVARWAIDHAGQGGEQQWIALYALARSPLAASDAAIGTLIAQPDDRLLYIVQGYASALHPHAGERLAELVALPHRTRELDYWLWRTLGEMKQAGRLERADELLAALPGDAADFDED
jgi:hypothetical protein